MTRGSRSYLVRVELFENTLITPVARVVRLGTVLQPSAQKRFESHPHLSAVLSGTPDPRRPTVPEHPGGTR
jgi:hypothetical protein